MALSFGTDGIRGYWDTPEFDQNTIRAIARAVGSFVSDQSNQPSVVIGGDSRASTKDIFLIVQEVLMTYGVRLCHLGLTTSPAVAYMTAQQNANLGMMITASHNPWHDNGLKFFSNTGAKLTAIQEQHFQQYLNNPKTPNQATGTTTTLSANPYLQHLQTLAPSGDFKAHIVLDTANGSAYALAPQLLQTLGLDYIDISSEPNGHNINEGCGATHPQFAAEKVLEHQADIGIVLDGDADRIQLIDHQGKLIDGDGILYIYANFYDLVGIAGTQMSNQALAIALENKGIEFIRTDVGDKYVLQALSEKQWQYGAEPSGHVINMQTNPTGDGLLSALEVLNIMHKTQKDLATLVAGYQPYPQILVNIEVKEHAKELIHHATVIDMVERITKQLNNKGRVLLRASGTEPLIRIMVEGEQKQRLQSYADEIAAKIKSL